MPTLKFDINVDAIISSFDGIKTGLKKDITSAAENLANMTHAKLLELARDNLKSLYKMYSENVEFSNPAPNIWVVTLKAPAVFIDDGKKRGFMSELLDGKSSKTSKDGQKYAVIPFEHSKPPTEQSPKAQNLANEIKSALKQKGISWKKIERDESGSPRLGKLHTFNIESPRLKDIHKTPATYGVSIYQRQTKTGKVKRDVMTFRVITEKHESEGLWMHPGMEGKKLMEKSLEWAMNTFDKEILPAILEKYKG